MDEMILPPCYFVANNASSDCLEMTDIFDVVINN